jgi:hypothetical protein
LNCTLHGIAPLLPISTNRACAATPPPSDGSPVRLHAAQSLHHETLMRANGFGSAV